MYALQADGPASVMIPHIRTEHPERKSPLVKPGVKLTSRSIEEITLSFWRSIHINAMRLLRGTVRVSVSFSQTDLCLSIAHVFVRRHLSFSFFFGSPLACT
jgi:hypothetical protein